ncbi:hypothetical protein ROSEINA2194_03451 [Roseburia inulinivorans DSM 16841]|uniref:Uncharacterized protein n=1 Tax=Roseburia inulinivorans DSM 16841 TaxID=622312 RepID=C0FXH1_9FIRM|nr:hypothetical protein ROSEINA2194_03451 [Roseburia inulinivorans DSM 16841]
MRRGFILLVCEANATALAGAEDLTSLFCGTKKVCFYHNKLDLR